MTAPARRESARRLVHLASGLVGVLAIRFPEGYGTLFVAAIFAAALLLEAARLLLPAGRNVVTAAAGSLYRPAEARRVSGATLLTGAYLAVWLVFPAAVAARAITVAAVADPAAAAVGSRFSGTPGRKSPIGSAAALAAAFAVLLLWPTALPAAAMAAAAAALAERVPGNGADNVAVPVATALVLAVSGWASA